MTATLSHYLEDNNDRMDAGWTHIRLYRDTVPDGAFATMVQAVELVADQLEYEFTDTTGGASHWYRVALYNSIAVEISTKGDPFKLDVTSLLDVMLAGAELAGAAFAGTCSALGTETSLVDELLRDHGAAADYQQAAWVYRKDAAAADLVRRLTGSPFDEPSGALTPVRGWVDPPTEGEAYQLYLLMPPFKYAGVSYGWADAARDGLQACEFEDRVDVGTGTATRTDEFDLGVHLGWVRRGDLKSVWLERYDVDTGQLLARLNASKQGRYWRTQPNGRGSLKLIVRPAPTVQQHVIVEADRRDAELYAADDITSCPMRLAARATAWKAFEHLDREHMGKYQGEVARAHADFLEEYQGLRPFASVST